MKHKNTTEILKNEKSGRDRSIRVLACFAIAAGLLTSCGGSDEDNLAILEWAGYDDLQYHTEYSEKYTLEPEYTLFSDQENALQRMRTGYNVDLVHLCTEQVTVAKDAGLIKPIDTSKIPRWNDVTPELLEMEGVRIDGEIWFVPWEWGYSTIAYNPDVIDVENATWDIFIDPEMEGKTALPITVGVNILIAAIIGEWADPHDPTEKEMAAAPEIFTKMLKNARFIWTDNTQLEQSWAAGDVGVSYVYGSASRRMVRDGMAVQVVEPLMTWVCGLSIGASGAGTDEMVYDYINAMLAPSSGVAMFEEYGYGHGNGKTVELIDPKRAEEAGLNDPEALFARGIFSANLPPAKQSRMIQLWFEAQAGLN